MSQDSKLFVSPEAFFEEEVKKGLAHRKIKTYPSVEKYLIDLLQHYLDAKNLFNAVNVPEGQKPPQTLAELYMTALSADQPMRRELLKTLADRSLYISGFFADSLDRKVIDVDYYVNMGTAAYAELARNTKEDLTAKVYVTFSSRFVDFVDVLTFISQNTQVTNNQNLLRLYDRYMKTGSNLAKEKLIEMGLLNLHPDQVKKSRQF